MCVGSRGAWEASFSVCFEPSPFIKLTQISKQKINLKSTSSCCIDVKNGHQGDKSGGKETSMGCFQNAIPQPSANGNYDLFYHRIQEQTSASCTIASFVLSTT